MKDGNHGGITHELWDIDGDHCWITEDFPGI